MSQIKSPLRYPGGKQKAVKQIAARFPASFSTYIEPFVGGGSLMLYVIQNYPQVFVSASDKNIHLMRFWRQSQIDASKIASIVRDIKLRYAGNGKKLYEDTRNLCWTDDSDLLPSFAANFFVLNRITFSGTLESGGYSEQAFQKRFTDSSIDRLEKLGKVLASSRVVLNTTDYKNVLNLKVSDPFIFLDPPYYLGKGSKLYGRKGDLHQFFDHEEFAASLKELDAKWLITYNDCEEIRDIFSFANIDEWSLQYGMNNYCQQTAKKGNELFISNY